MVAKKGGRPAPLLLLLMYAMVSSYMEKESCRSCDFNIAGFGCLQSQSPFELV